MYKRGSHVGVVLSFVIFITFLIFIYSILQPVMKVERDKQFLIDYLETALIKNISTDLISMTISLNYSEEPFPPGGGSYDCFNISHAQGSEGLNSDINIFIKDKYNSPLNHSSADELLKIYWPPADHGRKNYSKIYYSEEPFFQYTFTPILCHSPRGENLSLGLTRTQEYAFETKMFRLVDNYNADYEQIKEDLNVPNQGEFGFSFIFNNESIIETSEKQTSGNVYVAEIPIEYVDVYANISSGYLKLKVW